MVRIACDAGHCNELQPSQVGVLLDGAVARRLRFCCLGCGAEVEIEAAPAVLRVLANSGSPWLSVASAPAGVSSGSEPMRNTP